MYSNALSFLPAIGSTKRPLSMAVDMVGEFMAFAAIVMERTEKETKKERQIMHEG